MQNPCPTCKYGVGVEQSNTCQRGAAPAFVQKQGWCAKYNLPFPDEPDYFNELVELRQVIRKIQNTP